MPRPRLLSLAAVATIVLGCSRVTITRDELLSPDQPRTANPVVTISASGIRPDVNHINLGAPVRFINEDVVPHTLKAAPELGYGDCADIARLDTLAPGAEVVLAAQTQGICAIKDSQLGASRSFQALLVVH